MRPTPAVPALRRGPAALLLAGLLAALLVLGALAGSTVTPATAAPAPSQVAQRASGPASQAPAARAGCAEQGKRFRPTLLGIKGITTPRRVLALGRDANNVPKAPPLTATGKQEFAWDLEDHILVGSRHGVIKLNAHTYPDGSALGNLLINQLYPGNRMVARGAHDQLRCYDVVDRVQVPAQRRYRRYYRTTGPGRLAIAVCSGVRRGPGDWSHRTIWFAKQVR